MLSTSLFTAVLPEHAPSTLTTSEASPVGTSVALSGGAMSSSALEQLTGRWGGVVAGGKRTWGLGGVVTGVPEWVWGARVGVCGARVCVWG